MSTHRTFTAADVALHLRDLRIERLAAVRAGLLRNETYRRDLEAELEATRAAYVGAAVTEIAALRGQLSGRMQG